MAGKPALSVVPAMTPVAERIARLKREARALAGEHIDLLAAGLAEVERLAAEIAEGGDAYPVGVREIARRLATDNAAQAQAIALIRTRA